MENVPVEEAGPKKDRKKKKSSRSKSKSRSTKAKQIEPEAEAEAYPTFDEPETAPKEEKADLEIV